MRELVVYRINGPQSETTAMLLLSVWGVCVWRVMVCGVCGVWCVVCGRKMSLTLN